MLSQEKPYPMEPNNGQHKLCQRPVLVFGFSNKLTDSGGGGGGRAAGCNNSHYQNSQTCDGHTHLCHHHIWGVGQDSRDCYETQVSRKYKALQNVVPKSRDMSTAAAEVGQAAGPGEEVHLSSVGQCGQGTGVRVRRDLKEKGRGAR